MATLALISTLNNPHDT